MNNQSITNNVFNNFIRYLLIAFLIKYAYYVHAALYTVESCIISIPSNSHNINIQICSCFSFAKCLFKIDTAFVIKSVEAIIEIAHNILLMI